MKKFRFCLKIVGNIAIRNEKKREKGKVMFGTFGAMLKWAGGERIGEVFAFGTGEGLFC